MLGLEEGSVFQHSTVSAMSDSGVSLSRYPRKGRWPDKKILSTIAAVASASVYHTVCEEAVVFDLMSSKGSR